MRLISLIFILSFSFQVFSTHEGKDDPQIYDFISHISKEKLIELNTELSREGNHFSQIYLARDLMDEHENPNYGKDYRKALYWAEQFVMSPCGWIYIGIFRNILGRGRPKNIQDIKNVRYLNVMLYAVKLLRNEEIITVDEPYSILHSESSGSKEYFERYEEAAIKWFKVIRDKLTDEEFVEAYRLAEFYKSFWLEEGRYQFKIPKKCLEKYGHRDYHKLLKQKILKFINSK